MQVAQPEGKKDYSSKKARKRAAAVEAGLLGNGAGSGKAGKKQKVSKETEAAAAAVAAAAAAKNPTHLGRCFSSSAAMSGCIRTVWPYQRI